MTLPVKDITNLLPSANRTKLDSAKGEVTAASNRKMFNDILQEALRQTNNPVSTTGVAPLDKNQLALMIKNMQMQMNRQLFNIVLNNPEEGANFLPSKIMSDYGALNNIAALDASINRQISPKNNAQKPDINLVLWLDGFRHDNNALFALSLTRLCQTIKYLVVALWYPPALDI